jgi:membrane fusion protein, multidrug efflux system
MLLHLCYILLIVLNFTNPSKVFAEQDCIKRQEITAKSMGIVSKYFVKDGEQVKKGDPLVEFDFRLLKAGLKEAQAILEAANANEELAKDAFDRVSKISANESVTAQQINEIRIRHLQAKAGKKQAEAALERIKIQVEDSTLRAIIPGIVRGIPSSLGVFAQPGQSFGRIERAECGK